MKVLSIRQPYAFYVFNVGLNIVAQTHPVEHRGAVAINAVFDPGEFDFVLGMLKSNTNARKHSAARILLDGLDGVVAMQQSGIIGHVDLVDCVDVRDRESDPERALWAEQARDIGITGRYHYVFRNPVPFAEPIPLGGTLRPCVSDVSEFGSRFLCGAGQICKAVRDKTPFPSAIVECSAEPRASSAIMETVREGMPCSDLLQRFYASRADYLSLRREKIGLHAVRDSNPDDEEPAPS